jgi:hypothetical protein
MHRVFLASFIGIHLNRIEKDNKTMMETKELMLKKQLINANQKMKNKRKRTTIRSIHQEQTINHSITEPELEELLYFSYDLHDVVSRSRKLVNTMRRISVIDQYINEFNGMSRRVRESNGEILRREIIVEYSSAPSPHPQLRTDHVRFAFILDAVE